MGTPLADVHPSWSFHDSGTTADRVSALRGRPAGTRPDLSVVVPVNAQADLGLVTHLLTDVLSYRGSHRLEIVLVVNNYPSAQPPSAIEAFRRLGIVVEAVPSVVRRGEPPGFTARMVGARAASSNHAILLDADCRLADATALIDHYANALIDGAAVAYTPVHYREVDPAWSIRVRILVHHVSRWVKRNVFRVPTTRGSNYAIDTEHVLDLYDRGHLADEMNVGPTVRRNGGRVDYSRGRRLVVETSGRAFRSGWTRLARYLIARVRYNLRVLPGGADVHERTAGTTRRYPGAAHGGAEEGE